MRKSFKDSLNCNSVDTQHVPKSDCLCIKNERIFIGLGIIADIYPFASLAVDMKTKTIAYSALILYKEFKFHI